MIQMSQKRRENFIFAHTVMTRIQLITDALLQTKNHLCMKSSFFEPPIITLGGTQNAYDLIMDDLWINQKQWPNSQSSSCVHGGFARRTKRLAKEMHEFISLNDDFIISGHSLGGACAILLASYLKDNDKNVKQIITFGSPPLSTDEFQDFYVSQNLWSKTFNFVLPCDPVVKNVPIYKFVGQRIELEFEADSIWEHHNMKNYKLALESQLINNTFSI